MRRPVRPLIIGHRGARARAAENTLGSFRTALSMGADMIEFDVHQCKSGELIVIHDATLTRTTDKRGRVSRLTLKEITAARCANGESVPTLEETLDAVGPRTCVNVELKTRACAAAVTEFFRSRDLSRVEFSSFRWSALSFLRKHLPGARLGLLVTDISYHLAPFAIARRLECNSINPPMEILSPTLMNRARQNNLKVMVFGIRTTEDLERCFSLGVDGVFSDDPEQAFAAWQTFCVRRP